MKNFKDYIATFLLIAISTFAIVPQEEPKSDDMVVEQKEIELEKATVEAAQQTQSNCPSGISIHVTSGNEFIFVWSPIAGDRYNFTRAWNIGTHTGRDQYSLDISMPGSTDQGKPIYLPFTSRVWVANTSGTYGKTIMAWDPGSGVVIRLAHLNQFSSVVVSSWGGWTGAGTKVGYIGGSGGWTPHLHMTAYRNVRVGVRVGNRNITESEIMRDLSAGITPSYAQAQKFRLIAPSDNCDLVKFDDNATVYTYKFGQLYPVTTDAWKSMGSDIRFTPDEGSYDQNARNIPMRVLPGWQRSTFSISSQMAPPREGSVFKGNQNATVFEYRYGRKNPLSASRFGDEEWREFHWSEIQTMSQSYVDSIRR